MDGFMELVRGPLFRFAFTIAVVGLAAQAFQSAAGLLFAIIRAGDKRVDVSGILWRTADRLNPFYYLSGGSSRILYTLSSILFHIGVVTVPIFYEGHIRLWERALDVSWPALPASAADGLTLLTIATGSLLIILRLGNEEARKTSRIQDWVLTPFLVFAFAMGYLLGHPGMSPFGLSTTIVIHVLLAEVLLMIAPFTKIVHCVMLPFARFASEWTWRLVPGAAAHVSRTLGEENQR